MILPDIRHDRLLHSFYGMLIALPFVMLFGWFGVLLSALIFAGKELIFDLLLEKGKPEILDFVFSIVPAVLMALT